LAIDDMPLRGIVKDLEAAIFHSSKCMAIRGLT